MTLTPWRLAWRLVACATASGFMSPPAAHVPAPPATRAVEGRVVGEPYAAFSDRERLTLDERADAATRVLQARTRRGVSAWAYPAIALGLSDEVVTAARDEMTTGPTYDALVALSAAYLAPDDGEPAVRAAQALDAAARATAMAPARPEAWFNRAVAAERLGLARWQRTWHDYLRIDHESDWAVEAERRAETSSGGPPGADAEQARIAVELEWLPAWATQVQQRDAAAAAAALGAARESAERLAATRGDASMIDLVAEIGTASSSAVAAARVLARDQARRRLDAGRPHEACAILRAPGRPGHGVAALLHGLLDGTCRYYEGDHAAARRVLISLLDLTDRRGYTGLAGRIHFVLGAVAVRSADPGAADRHYRQAITALDQAGELDLLAAARAILARQWHDQGDDASAWDLLRDAFAGLAAESSANIRYSVLTTAVRVAHDGGLDGLALHFQDALQLAATDARDPALAVDALTQRATTLAALGATAAAGLAVDAARSGVAGIGDPLVRPVAAALVDEAAARVAAAVDPCAAIGSYGRAIDAVDGRLNQKLPMLLEQLAESLERCGRIDDAARAYERGIDAFEAAAARHDDTVRRLRHTDRLWDLYGRLARLQATRLGQVEKALLTVDRGRSLRGGRRDGDPAGRLHLLRERLGSAAALVYLALDDETLVWAVTGSAVVCHRIPVGAARLDALVAQWTRRVNDGLPDRDVGHDLYRLLVEPVAAATTGPMTIVVPDGPLHALSFSALWTGSSYLVERTAFWTALSLDAAVPPTVRPPRARVRAVVVGGPTLAPPTALPPLPYAEAEARDVAGLYARAELLLGRHATRSAVLEAFHDADVVHVAAHALVRSAQPFDSEIPLAGGAAASLRVRDLGALTAPPRLVVLASCRSAAGRPSRGYGAISLASALAANGASAAVGTLWEIDDASAPALSRELHSRLAAGDSVAMAVRAGQLAMLRRSGALGATRVWAALVGVGQPQTVVVQRPTPRG